MQTLSLIYFEKYKWDGQVIVVDGNPHDLRGFMNSLTKSSCFALNKRDGSPVTIVEQTYQTQDDEVCVSFTAEDIKTIENSIDGLLATDQPAHDYIDLSSGFTMIISLDSG